MAKKSIGQKNDYFHMTESWHANPQKKIEFLKRSFLVFLYLSSLAYRNVRVCVFYTSHYMFIHMCVCDASDAPAMYVIAGARSQAARGRSPARLWDRALFTRFYGFTDWRGMASDRGRARRRSGNQVTAGGWAAPGYIHLPGWGCRRGVPTRWPCGAILKGLFLYVEHAGEREARAVPVRALWHCM